MKVSDGIRSLVPYAPGKPIAETKRELGLEEVYKLASNESPLGPSSKVLAAITQSLSEINRYPDSGCFELKLAMGEYLARDPSWLAFGNGSNELIDILIRVFCEPGEAILTSQAAFLAYSLCAQASRVKVVETPLTPDLRFDLPEMTRVLEDSPWSQAIRLVFIANPNNPTGTYVTNAEFENFMKVAGNRDDLLVIVDEAYFEFVRAPDCASVQNYMDRYENLVLLRTMSKVFGLAALRLGVLVARPNIVDYVNRVRNPFNVNLLAQVAATAALRDRDHLTQVCEITWEGLDYFYRELKRMKIPYWPSQANFVLMDTQREARQVYEALLKKGVILRQVANYGFPQCLRLSVGLKSENEKAVQALEQVLRELPLETHSLNNHSENLLMKTDVHLESPSEGHFQEMNEKGTIVTIDGPAASGKTSVSREVARRLGWRWVSTGAFYRGLAYILKEYRADLDHEDEIAELAQGVDWEVVLGSEQTRVILKGEDVTKGISHQEIGEMASRISQFSRVRESLLQAQRDCAIGVRGLVAEGRDCGTVVFPHADLKFYLEAKSESRAARRAQEVGSSVNKIRMSQDQRDNQDLTRKIAPLQVPEGAFVIDTSELSLEEVINKVERTVRAQLKWINN